MIAETSKKVLFAAVGAPVVAARKLSERVTEMSGKFSEDLSKEYDLWAKEGEKVVTKVTDRQAVEEFVEDLGAKMDFDQIQEQVGKLREQLDDMLSNWRSSFRPATEKVEPVKAAATPAAKPAAAKTTTAAKKPAAKKTTTAAKKPAAKKTTTAAKKPAAPKASTTA
jgi:polyhydroxyalkanoate synthesis regulator phasin